MKLVIDWDKNSEVSDQQGFWYSYEKAAPKLYYKLTRVSIGYGKYGIEVDSHLNIIIFNYFATGCGG